jgi:FkbM family methyltransferase
MDNNNFKSFDIDIILRNFELNMVLQATRYNLRNEDQRKLSTKLLENLYININKFLQPNIYFEIGAHQATFSKTISSSQPKAKIYAFEANPYVYENFKDDIIHNFKNIQYIHSAISNMNGMIDFHVLKKINQTEYSQKRGYHSIFRRSEGGEYEVIKIPSRKLSDFIKTKKLSGSFSAWIDVEGAQKEVLQSMGHFLNQFACIYIEVEDFQKWQEQWISFDVIKFLIINGFIPIARDFEYEMQYNIIFIKNYLMDHPWIKKLFVDYLSYGGNLYK